jgi:hypothetical protein
MIKQLLLGSLLLACVSAAGISSGAARTTNCISTLPAGSYDSLNVPSGQACIINSGRVEVSGNVTVGSEATLSVSSPAEFTVDGSLLAVNAASISITPAAMGMANIMGSVSASGTLGAGIVLQYLFIGGTVSVVDSDVGIIDLSANNVAGNVVVRTNSTSKNLVHSDLIQDNTIGGSLDCADNMPPPEDLGKPNTVGGNKVGQCSGL